MSNPWATLPTKPSRTRAESVTVAQRIAELVEEYGSVNRAAREIDLEPAYLYRLQRLAAEPDAQHLRMSDETLEKMGLVRIVTFERLGK